jgi:predicted GNAT family acetyltransferase
MSNIQFTLSENSRGKFYVMDGSEQVAEMTIGITGDNLTVYHTEVSEKLRGSGLSGKLLMAMISYARGHSLKVIPLCKYVRMQFERHPELYNDIWNKDWHK